MCADSFLICFWQFYFLTQTDDFAKALHGGHFCQYSKYPHFSNLSCFLERFFAYNNYIVSVDSFLICFWKFYFLTQTHDFAKATAFACRLFLPILKLLSFFDS